MAAGFRSRGYVQRLRRLVWNSGVSGNTVWNGSFFTNGDSAQFSLALSNSITLGDNITVANILSNGATTPTTLTITGSAGKTLTLGTGVAGSGNIGARRGGSRELRTKPHL